MSSIVANFCVSAVVKSSAFRRAKKMVVISFCETEKLTDVQDLLSPVVPK